MVKFRFMGTMELGKALKTWWSVCIQRCCNRIMPDDRESVQIGIASDRGIYQ